MLNKLDSGTATVTSAGTRVQLNNSKEQAIAISVRARPGNTGDVYFGDSGVSSSAGWTLQPGESTSIDFGSETRRGTVQMLEFYVDADNNNDQLNWIALLVV